VSDAHDLRKKNFYVYIFLNCVLSLTGGEIAPEGRMCPGPNNRACHRESLEHGDHWFGSRLVSACVMF
jgi:hypothetical protein